LSEDWTKRLRSLLEAPSPAVLTTYREDGSALVSPVWFRFADGAFEIVVAEGDVKLTHLARDPRSSLVVFEAVPPFRGIEVRGEREVVEKDVTEERELIAGRYLGAEAGLRFRSRAAGEAGRPPPAGIGEPARVGPLRDPPR
jgi:PPOX class probable F420-dependent enzyme